MTDDPVEIRAQARRATALAGRARAAAVAVSGSSTVRWRSLGADRYRDRLTERAADFRARADDLDRLSRLLLAHARHVEDHEALLAAGVDAGVDVAAGAAKSVGKAFVKGVVKGVVRLPAVGGPL